MNSINKEDLIIKTLRSAFPQAICIRVREKSIETNSLHITSEIVNLTIEYEQNNESHLKYLTLKIPLVESPAFAMRVKLNIFEREAYTYQTVLPRMNQFLDTNISPLHFCTTDSGILVLENLVQRGYKCAPGDEFLDDRQFCQLLKTLAKFHAASVKVRQQHPRLLADTIFEDQKLSAELQPYHDEWIPVIGETLKRADLAHLIPKATAILSTITHENGIKRKISDHYPLIVFNHGDYRRENVLIKYNGQRPIDVKIIDFQFCTWSTPVLDFLYCLITSVRTDFIEQHFADFVNQYVQYLQQMLLELGCDQTYDQANFMADFDKIKLSMNVALMSLCNILSYSADRRNPPQVDLPNEIPHCRCLDDPNFVRIVSYWIEYFDKVGALDASYANTAESQIDLNPGVETYV